MPRREFSLASPIDRALFLRAQPTFAGLRPSEISALAMLCRERFARAGEWLHHEGTPMTRVAFLIDGEVRSMREGEPIRTFNAPATLGLAAAVTERDWNPGIVATEPTLFLTIESSELRYLLAEHTSLVLEIARSGLRERLPAIVRNEKPGSIDDAPGMVPALLALGQNPLFENVKLIGLIELVGASIERRLNEDAEYAQPSDAMVLVLRGALERAGAAADGVAHPGDLVGLGGFLDGPEPPSASIARGECRLLEIPHSGYRDLLEDHGDAGEQLLTYVIEREQDF